jgi:hypothetical protein
MASISIEEFRRKNIYTTCNKRFCLHRCVQTKCMCTNDNPCTKKQCKNNCQSISCNTCSASMCRFAVNGCSNCNGLNNSLYLARDSDGTRVNPKKVLCGRNGCDIQLYFVGQCESVEGVEHCVTCNVSHWCRECIFEHGFIGG